LQTRKLKAVKEDDFETAKIIKEELDALQSL